MESMLSLSRERFSARKFTAEPVSQEDLEYIMKCVRMAPSACNKQPWRWLVVRSEAAKKTAPGVLRPRMVSHGAALYRRTDEREGKLGAQVRQLSARRHRCRHCCRASLPCRH